MQDRLGPVRVAFVGREPQTISSADHSRERAQSTFDDLARKSDERVERRVVVNRQVHSTRIVAAEEAPLEADGLFIGDRRGELGRALCVFTADCVPVLLADRAGRLAAVHAGWRGLAGGIVMQAAERFPDAPPTAWIGPSIGSCCYEVSQEVALAVAARSGAGVVMAPRVRCGRPHLDLVAAAHRQLRHRGVEDVRIVRHCTQCDPAWHSYRREGPGQGRNHAFVW